VVTRGLAFRRRTADAGPTGNLFNCLVNFFVKIALADRARALSIFSAVHKFQATAIEAGIAASQVRVPPEVLATPQGTDPDNKSSILVRWHVA
jgi:hypothetical protein